MTDDIEVLVHIATSATRENDELFRSVANAYTAFEPHKVHRRQRLRKATRSAKASRAVQLSANASPSIVGNLSTPKATEPPVPSASRELYGSFPSQVSFDKTNQSPGPALDDLVHPISRLAQLDQSYLSWRKRGSPRATFNKPRDEPQMSSDGLEDADTGFIEDSQSALQALQSQLEDTWSMTSEDSYAGDTHPEVDANGHTQLTYELSPAGNNPIRDSQEVTLPASPDHHDPPKVEASPPGHGASPFESRHKAYQSDLASMAGQLDFSKLPVDAMPPAPAISVASPAILPSQITKHLAVIKSNNPSRFRPLRIKRSLEADERGYWRVDCNKWPPRTQQDFWSSLYENVCSGRIGWGLTLHRESTSPSTLGLVRLYCWGEVVEHMWLLMWLCSQGGITNSGSSWIDADGIAAISMV